MWAVFGCHGIFVSMDLATGRMLGTNKNVLLLLVPFCHIGINRVVKKINLTSRYIKLQKALIYYNRKSKYITNWTKIGL